jgi:hypothetical protein
MCALALGLLLAPHAVASEPPDETARSVASFHYTLVGIAKFEGVSYASFIDERTGDHFLLSTQNKSDREVTLTAVHTQDDPSGTAAIVLSAGVSLLLGFEAAVVAPSDLASSVNPASNLPRPGSTAVSELKPPPGATLPLVFAEVDPRKMTLTDDQKATLSRLRQDFIKAVKGTDPATTSAAPATPADSASPSPATNPSSPSPTDTALPTWETAQEKSDEEFRMLYGTQAFLAYQESSSYPSAP